MTQLRVGIVGAGGISRVHADGWLAQGAQLNVFSTKGAEEFAQTYGATLRTSFAQLVENADVIDVVTPSTHHLDYVLGALAAGKHVVCEKPLARTTTDALAMLDAASQSPGRLFPAHVVRYFPEYEAARGAVIDGKIGRPAVLRFSRAGSAPTAGSWFFNEELSGGIIMDQMIHDLDQARWMAGEVTSVYAVQNPGPDSGAELVVAHVVLTHANGAISYVQGTWGARGMRFTTSFEVAGSDGVLRYDSGEDPSLRTNLVATGSASGYLPTSGGVSPYTREITEFARCIETGDGARISIEEAVVAVALAEAARQSVRSGESVAFDERALLQQVEGGAR